MAARLLLAVALSPLARPAGRSRRRAGSVAALSAAILVAKSLLGHAIDSSAITAGIYLVQVLAAGLRIGALSSPPSFPHNSVDNEGFGDNSRSRTSRIGAPAADHGRSR